MRSNQTKAPTLWPETPVGGNADLVLIGGGNARENRLKTGPLMRNNPQPAATSARKGRPLSDQEPSPRWIWIAAVLMAMATAGYLNTFH
jgi:hypothetical protein